MKGKGIDRVVKRRLPRDCGAEIVTTSESKQVECKVWFSVPGP
jgi:hypothetical protein